VLIYLLLAGAAARTVRATLLAFFALSYGVTLASHAATIGIPAPTWLARWSIDRLIPYAKNARTHSDAQIAAIAASIKEAYVLADTLRSRKITWVVEQQDALLATCLRGGAMANCGPSRPRESMRWRMRSRSSVTTVSTASHSQTPQRGRVAGSS
jgi:hypothetical protein